VSPQPDSRRVAWEVLREVHENGAYANLALPRVLEISGLDSRDKGFATELVYGLLRREGELDIVISHAASRPVSDIDSLALDCLRLGVYQVLYLRVPNHAAVDQTVRLAKSVGAKNAVGFVNAVLRKITRESRDYWDAVIAADSDTQQSHPAWIAAEIRGALAETGDEGELGEALAAHNESPLVGIVCLPGLSTPQEADHRTPYSPLGVILQGGDPRTDSRVSLGSARVQDEGSSLAALVLSRVQPLGAGDRVLDMCAGPGGKTAVLAGEAAIAGASLLAIEKVPQRVGLVRGSTELIRRESPGVLEIVEGDARNVTGSFERILLDAPCSGLGALRRRPEARWRKSPDDLVALTLLQRELLDQGLRALAPGGFLAYVTCSPVVRETTDIVRTVCSRHPDVEAVDTSSVLDRVARQPVPGAARGSAVQLWTHRHGTDAMFIQLLHKPLPR
jgi:16S rRNA (cytosine967-C5)-methyltransferase